MTDSVVSNWADLILKSWTTHRELFARNQQHLSCLAFLFVSQSASQWSCFIRKSPSLCISITTHTHTWAPAVLPSGDAMCELKGLMQKRFNPRKNLYFLYYSISVVVMSSIALLNAVVWMTNQHRLRFPASLQSFSE